MKITEHIEGLIKASLFRNSFVMLAAGFLTGVLGYLFHALVSRRLSVAQYGELQSLISLLTILSVFTSALSYLGIKYATIMAAKNDKISGGNFLRWLRRVVWRLAIWLSLVYVLLCPLLGRYLNLQDWRGLIIVGVAGIFTVLAVADQSVLTGWESFVEVGTVNVFGAAIKLLSGVWIAIYFPRASAVIGGCLMASLMVWWLLRIFTQKKLETSKGNMPDNGWRERYVMGTSLRESGVPIIIYSWLIAVINSIDILMVKHLSSSDMAGYYSALSVLGKIVLWGNLAIVTVVLPRAVAKNYAGERISRKVRVGVYGLIMSIGLLLVGGYYWFPYDLIRIFFGDRYTQFSDVLWLFGVMALVLTLLQLEANFAFARSDWRVSYLLALVIVLMVISAYLLATSITTLVLGMIASLMVGYICVWSLNSLGRRAAHNG